MFNQSRIELDFSTVTVVACLLPSMLAACLFAFYPSERLGFALLILFTANVFLVWRASHLNLRLDGFSLFLDVNESELALVHENHNTKFTKREQITLQECLWLSTALGIITVKSEQGRSHVFFLHRFSVKNPIELRRFKVHTIHNKHIQYSRSAIRVL